MSDEMVAVKKEDLQFVRDYCTGLEGMKTLLTRERDEARARVSRLEKRLAELENQRADLATTVVTQKAGLHNQQRTIADLEKRLAEQNWPVDATGKTPGEVYSDAFRSVPLQVPPQDATEYAAQAVLRAFGNQRAAEALGNVRAAHAERFLPHDDLTAFIDSELAELEGPTKPAIDHAHEVGSCSHCDTQSITDPQKPTKPAEIMDTTKPVAVTVINLVIDGVAHTLDTSGLCGIVSRDGPNAFKQTYKNHGEARKFYATLVGVAYIRTFCKGFETS